MRGAFVLIAGVCLLLTPPVAAGGAQGGQTPQQAQDKGGEAASQACTQCHALRYVNLQQRTAEQWRDTVYDMISRGAQVKPEEIELITGYLAANFGPKSGGQAAAREQARPQNMAAGAAAQGEPDAAQLYATHCQICHTAAGTAGTASMNFADSRWNHGSALTDIVKTISDGVAGTNMQGFRNTLTEQEIQALARRVRAFDATLKTE